MLPARRGARKRDPGVITAIVTSVAIRGIGRVSPVLVQDAEKSHRSQFL
jgi:hypothetical protein